MKTKIISDGNTVWVNADDGCCLARFSRFGIDIHKDAAGQISGEGQCLECKIGPATMADWIQFCDGMIRHYAIKITKKHMPKFLRTQSKVREGQ